MLIVVANPSVGRDAFLNYALSEYEQHASEAINVHSVNLVRCENKYVITNPPPFISLAHSNDIIVCALASLPVGVDVQFIKTLNYMQFSTRYFSRIIIDQKEFFTYWTFAEAKAKCTGEHLYSVLKTGSFINCRTIPLHNDYILSVYTKDSSEVALVNYSF
jgi:hypothetical protein